MQKSQRLIQMMMLINAKKAFTVQELADEFGLSTRTVTRDLQELSELGVPVYSVQGRGGGYRLLQERLLPPIAFTESEAVALFIAGQSLQYLGSVPFEEGTVSALHKFYHYLPADTKKQIDRLKDRVAVWSPHRKMSPDCLKVLMQAVMTRSAVTIEYDSRRGTEPRDIQPVGLYSSNGYWYCPAYCLQREEYRLFRADRIRSAGLNPSIPFRDEVDRRTLRNPPDNTGAETLSFTIELTPNGVRSLRSDQWFGKSINRREDGSGTATIRIAAENLAFYADLAWGLGADARITEPTEAIEYTKRKIDAMKSLYV
ncbi:helix-turn-helix transcriptional regulator [Cohnella herbarum]|uniref:YafY family transcriptional regulator n=1 Tax=Cohnella herbarum TaxID=2728023 RepID=A0A7Z2VMF9_9BACL|nr:YafY family protein [Cohnella herbarum]QJD85530.1 YafY family transcriptional regulator [Cohnella herbarum]